MTITFHTGEVLECLAKLPDASVDCVVTSPPYYGLRDYGVEGQIGLEKTPEEYIEKMVKVFREVGRVLKKTGTVWLNLGDSYGGSWGNYGARAGNQRSRISEKWSRPAYEGRNRHKGKPPTVTCGVAAKNLIGVPWRVAFALQADGWILRSEIVWAKPNPMPESVKDRPGSAHEKIFLLTKNQRYFYDYEAVKRPQKQSSLDREKYEWHGNEKRGYPGNKQNISKYFAKKSKEKKDKQRGHSRRHAGFNDRWDQMAREEQIAGGANLKNVWTMPTKPFPEAHFATFPPELPETCIKAGCPKGGTVLDPFAGAGTTGLVADRLQRDAILIELNPEYMEIAKRRIAQEQGMFADMEAAE